jgi:hypothetical protein
MKRKLPLLAALFAAIAAFAVVGTGVALAFDSGGNPGALGDNTITWTGQGTTDGELNTSLCGDNADVPDGVDPNNYLHWIFTTDGGEATITGSQGLHLGGTGSGDYSPDTDHGNSFSFYTPAFELDGLTAYADFTVTETGHGAWNLVISHGCDGGRTTVDGPTVTKEVFGSFDRECNWTITKNALPSSLTVDAGQPAVFHYRVHLTATCNRIEQTAVSGTITVNNSASGNITLDSITDDYLSDGTSPCTVDTTGGLTVGPGNTQFPVTCDVSDYNNTDGNAPPDDLTNTVTIAWSAQDVGDTEKVEAGSDDFTTEAIPFTETLTDNCVDVTDSVDGAEAVSIGDGHYCIARDEESGELTGTDVKIAYDRTFTGPASGTCADHNNTAYFADNSTPQLTGQASATVRVCSFKAALTIGYWKTHLGRNGTCPSGLPTGTGCSANGPWTSQYLGSAICDGCVVGKLGNYTVTTITQAANVFAANNCSNASSSDSNAAACLAAQLLAAQLNVANGANTCICDTIKDAKAFLTAVGYNGPGSAVTFDATHTRAMAISLKTALDNYNNGVGCH